MMQRDKIAQTDGEIDMLKRLVDSTFDIQGDLAEVGVFHGGTASIIHDVMSTNKNLYLYDTYVDDYDGVLGYFKDIENVRIIKSDFDGSQQIKGKFSFIHIDTDLYEPTLRTLEVFYPLMSKGGIILVHDYTHISCSGPQIACCNFFANKPEKVIKNESQGFYIIQ